MTGTMEEYQNSSAYSSLANSTNEISETSTVKEFECGGGGGGGKSSVASARTPKAASLEIRTIIQDYNATLNKATKEIKSLSCAKKNLEKEYEKLLTLNENLAKDLENTLHIKKSLQQEQKLVLKANDDLYQEAQRLNDVETENQSLKSETRRLSKELESLDKNSCVSQVLAAKNSKIVEALQEEKTRFVAAVARLEVENKTLKKNNKMLGEQKEEALLRNERIAGENMQMIVEAQEFGKIKSEICNDLKELKAKYKDLERENSKLTQAMVTDEESSKRKSPENDEKLSKLIEQNKNLTEWREQLVVKNQNLVDENKKLREKCDNLEELLNEEETDINDVLELIRTMQLASKSGTNPGPISPMSAISAKLRDLNYK